MSYPGQPSNNRLYRPGYEKHLMMLPTLNYESSDFDLDLNFTNGILDHLASKIIHDRWTLDEDPGPGEFKRHILAIQDAGDREGPELLVAHWGNQFQSPVHGHAADALLYENLLHGSIVVNTYQQQRPHDNIVRLIRTEFINKPGTFLSGYTPPGNYAFPRPGIIHNFKSIGYSASLHYVGEHTRDGRDNGFVPEYFDISKYGFDSVDHISAFQGTRTTPGDVVLVNSPNVPFGMHYIVITGPAVIKHHGGLRPQDVAISAPDDLTQTWVSEFLNLNPVPNTPTELMLLKLKPDVASEFLKFHNIQKNGRQITFPEPIPMTI